MYTYNITWQDMANPSSFNKSCHVQADDLMGVALAFNKIYPTGKVLGVKLND